jgi:hypothetical protein
MAARPPEFGEQTEEVLAEPGFGETIADLRQRKGFDWRPSPGSAMKAPKNRASHNRLPPVFGDDRPPTDSYVSAKSRHLHKVLKLDNCSTLR